MTQYIDSTGVGKLDPKLSYIGKFVPSKTKVILLIICVQKNLIKTSVL
jgi:hypothetical protein